MYAIIEDQGRQYTVRAGDVIRIDRKDANEREQLTFDRV
ncbi:MAG: bL21 family ribosomal protein, partial [Planctomycetota bacterium]